MYKKVEDFSNDYVVDNISGCWNWKWAKNAGYGIIVIKTIRVAPLRVHRLIYEIVNGPIRSDLEIDHICNNRSCINPDHLQAITHQQNISRAFEYKPKVCAKGHGPLHKRPSDGWLYCKICNSSYQRRQRTLNKLPQNG